MSSSFASSSSAAAAAAVIGGSTMSAAGGGNTQMVQAPSQPPSHDTPLKNRTFYHRYEATGDNNNNSSGATSAAATAAAAAMGIQQQSTGPPPSSSSGRESSHHQTRHGHHQTIPTAHTYSNGLDASSFHPLTQQQDPSAFVSYLQSQQHAAAAASSFKGESSSAVVFDSVSGPAIYMHPTQHQPQPHQPHQHQSHLPGTNTLRGGATSSSNTTDRGMMSSSGQLFSGGLNMSNHHHHHPHYETIDPYIGSNAARVSLDNFRQSGYGSSTAVAAGGTSNNLCEGTTVPSSAGIPSVVGTVSSSYLGGNSTTIDGAGGAVGSNIPSVSSSRHQLICVAERLLQDYYTRLSQQPSSLASLYLDDAEVIYTGRELNTDAILVTGKSEIEEFFSSETAAKFNGARVMVEALHPLVSPLSPYAVVLFVKGRVWFPRLAPPLSPLVEKSTTQTSDKRSSIRSSGLVLSHNDMISEENTFVEKSLRRNNNNNNGCPSHHHPSQQTGPPSFVMSAFYHYLCMAPHPKCPSWGGAPLQYFVANEHFHLNGLPLSSTNTLRDFDVTHLTPGANTGTSCDTTSAVRITDNNNNNNNSTPNHRDRRPDIHTQQVPLPRGMIGGTSPIQDCYSSGTTTTTTHDQFPPIGGGGGEVGNVLNIKHKHNSSNNSVGGVSSLRSNREANQVEQQNLGHHLHGSRSSLGQNINSVLGFQENNNNNNKDHHQQQQHQQQQHQQQQHNGSVIRDGNNNNSSSGSNSNLFMSRVLDRKKGRVVSGGGSVSGAKGLGRQTDNEEKSSSCSSSINNNNNTVLGTGRSGIDSSPSRTLNSNNRYPLRKTDQNTGIPQSGSSPSTTTTTTRGGRRNVHMNNAPGGSSSGSLNQSSYHTGAHQSEFSLHGAVNAPCDLPSSIDELKSIITEAINRVPGCENSICVDIYRPRNQDPNRPFFFIHLDSHHSMSTLKAAGSITILTDKKIILSSVKPPRSGYRQRFNNNISNSPFMRRTMHSTQQPTTNTTSVETAREVDRPTGPNETKGGTNANTGNSITNGSTNITTTTAGTTTTTTAGTTTTTTTNAGPSGSVVLNNNNNRTGNIKGPFQRNRWGGRNQQGNGLHRNTFNNNNSHSGQNRLSGKTIVVSNDSPSESAVKSNVSRNKDSPSDQFSAADSSVPATTATNSTENCKMEPKDLESVSMNTAGTNSSSAAAVENRVVEEKEGSKSVAVADITDESVSQQ